MNLNILSISAFSVFILIETIPLISILDTIADSILLILLIKMIFFSSLFSPLSSNIIFIVNPQGIFSFKYDVLPEQTKYPSKRIPILSLKHSASSKECVVIIIILSLLYFLKICQNFLFISISIPLVGSSKIIIGELLIRVNATHNFLFCPSDNKPQG